MSLKITTLIENTKDKNSVLKSEHGLSFFIEKDGHKLLFDTGQSGKFLGNAEQLQIDLSDLEYVIISHGHYDHSGGFEALTGKAKKFELIVGDGFFNKKYGYKNNSYEFLGNNFDEELLVKKKIPFTFIKNDITEILPGFYVITNFQRIYVDEVVNTKFKLMEDGKYVNDSFNDEVLAAIDTPEGLVILLGCSHPGMKNMLDTVRKLLETPIYAVLGGTHLVEANNDSLNISMDYLNNGEMKVLGVSHCTGQKAMADLSISNDRYFHNRTGSTLVVE